MQDLDTQISELETEIKSRELEYNGLEERKKSLEREIEAIDQQIRALRRQKISYPNNYPVGIIPNLKGQLKTLMRLRDDMKLPVVYFTDGIDRDYRVARITPKRIYIRKTGQESEDYYDLDGTYRYCYSDSLAINIARTFPDGFPKTKTKKEKK